MQRHHGFLNFYHPYGHVSDIQTWEVAAVLATLTQVQTDATSLACPALPGSLAITSRTVADVICDTDEPLSVNTA